MINFCVSKNLRIENSFSQVLIDRYERLVRDKLRELWILEENNFKRYKIHVRRMKEPIVRVFSLPSKNKVKSGFMVNNFQKNFFITRPWKQVYK